MPDAFTATLGVLGLTGGGVALLNYRKAVLWKRAELANNYLKDFYNNPELVFAGRCLASALDRRLFLVADLQDVGYWVAKIQSEVVVHGFIVAYGYEESIERLIRLYRGEKSPYQNWIFPKNTTAVEQSRQPERAKPG